MVMKAGALALHACSHLRIAKCFDQLVHRLPVRQPLKCVWLVLGWGGEGVLRGGSVVPAAAGMAAGQAHRTVRRQGLAGASNGERPSRQQSPPPPGCIMPLA